MIPNQEQILSSHFYTDNLAAGATLETTAAKLVDDLDGLRSQVNKILDGTGSGNWYSALLDQFGLLQIHNKKLALRDPIIGGTTDFTLGATLSGVLIQASQLNAGSPLIAVGASSTTSAGYIAADESNFTVAGTLGVGLSTAVDGASILVNRVNIVDASTNDPVLAGSGEVIFGLLQTVTGTSDGAAVAGGGSENLQISFAYIPAGTDVITATTLDAATYHFSPTRCFNFYEFPLGGTLTGDAELPDVIDPGSTVPRLQQRKIEISAPGPVLGPAANDPMNVQTGTFTTAGAQTLIAAASFGTTVLPATGAAFVADDRIKIYRNGILQDKGASASDNRQVYWLSTTQIAFEDRLFVGGPGPDTILIQTPAAY